jgi:signal transduction histidine kinase
LSLYFVYVFIAKKDASPLFKGILILLFLPVLLIYPTDFHLNGFDTTLCEAVEQGIFTSFYYGESVLIFFWILIFGAYQFFREKSWDSKRQILLLILGIELFLISFFVSSAYATYVDNFALEQYGLFGMVIFIIFLAYLTIRYKAFNIKLIGAQALTVALILIIAAQFTYTRTTISYVLNGVALILVSVAGYYLIKSIGQEVKRKEELEVLSRDLKKANERLQELDKQKSEFISIASHQLRTPLTAIKGYVSLLLEGSYGKLDNGVTDVLDKVYSVNDRLVHLVEDLLNVSRIEAGRIQYNFQPTQLATILTELHDMFAMNAKVKGLEFTLSLPKEILPLIIVDPNKIKEITSNLIDNAIKYTPEGSVSVSLEKVGENAHITIKDTGIGIKPEDKDNLFNKFVRSKETSRMVVGGAGLGLFVGKSFVQAHGGKIWAESEGAGKGSTFIIELPIVNPNLKTGIVEKKQEA